MSKIPIKAFAKKFDIAVPNIYNYCNRGKLYAEKGWIDEEIGINKEFIINRLKKKDNLFRLYGAEFGIGEENPKVQSKVKELKEPKNNDSSLHLSMPPIEKERFNAKTSDIEQIKKSSEYRDLKLREEIRYLQSRNDRIEGYLIPTDAVKSIIGEVIARYKTAFLQETEQLIRDMLNEVQAGNKVITRSTSKLIDIANGASSRAIAESKQAILKIIQETAK